MDLIIDCWSLTHWNQRKKQPSQWGTGSTTALNTGTPICALPRFTPRFECSRGVHGHFSLVYKIRQETRAQWGKNHCPTPHSSSAPCTWALWPLPYILGRIWCSPMHVHRYALVSLNYPQKSISFKLNLFNRVNFFQPNTMFFDLFQVCPKALILCQHELLRNPKKLWKSWVYI